jgi:hypothetical protein
MTGQGGPRFSRRAVLAAPAATAAWPIAAQEPAVDLLLILAVDASGSIDADEFALQREGIAEAIANSAVLAAIRSQPRGAIGIAMVEWGSPGRAETVVDWLRITDSASAAAAAQAFRDAPRSRQSYNAIGDALVLCGTLFAAAPWQASERTVDVSGDGPDMRSRTPAPEARDALVAQGVVVNGLAIEVGSNWRDGRLAELYERDVMGGPGAFVMRAEDRRDFARAMRAKMVREIAAAPTRIG